MYLIFNDKDSILDQSQKHISRTQIDSISFTIDAHYVTLSSTSATGRRFIPIQSTETFFLGNEQGRYNKITVSDLQHFAETMSRGGQKGTYHLRDVLDHVQRLAISSKPVSHSIRGEEGFLKILSGRHITAEGDDWDNQFTLELDTSMRTGKRAKAKVDGRYGTDVVTLNLPSSEIVSVKLKKMGTPQQEWLIISGKKFAVAIRSIEVISFDDETLTDSQLRAWQKTTDSIDDVPFVEPVTVQSHAAPPMDDLI